MYSKEELYDLIIELTDQLTIIKTNESILEQIISFRKNNQNFEYVTNHSNTFWIITINNIKNEVITGLARLYDEHSDAFSLNKIINICEQHQKLFLDPTPMPLYQDWEERNTTTPMCIIKQLKDRYLETVAERQKLKSIRDKAYSHLDRQYIFNPSSLFENFSWDDVEKLIDVAEFILTHILIALYNMTSLFVLADHDDVEYLMKISAYGYERKKNERHRRFSAEE